MTETTWSSPGGTEYEHDSRTDVLFLGGMAVGTPGKGQKLRKFAVTDSGVKFRRD